jgi:hypothetical protein
MYLITWYNSFMAAGVVPSSTFDNSLTGFAISGFGS